MHNPNVVVFRRNKMQRPSESSSIREAKMRLLEEESSEQNTTPTDSFDPSPVPLINKSQTRGGEEMVITSINTADSTDTSMDSMDITIDSILTDLNKGDNNKYTNRVLLKCGFANASDAVEIVAVSFILEHAAKDFNLSGWQEGLLTSVIFLGMMIGGWFWGSLSDSEGRTKVLRYSLFINALFGFLSIFSPEYYTLLLCRFFSGIGVGGSIPVIFSYCSEFLPPDTRGAQISLMAISWPIGTLFTSLMAWALIPTLPHHGSFFGTVHSWRLFLIPCCIPALVGSVMFGYFSDESFKWLIYEKKDYNQASLILRNIAVWNGCDTVRMESVTRPNSLRAIAEREQRDQQRAQEQAAQGSTISQQSLQRVKNAEGSWQEIQAKSLLLFEPCFRKQFVCFVLIYFCLSFAFYGLYEFLPSYFSGLSNVNPYLSSVITSIAQIPGVVITMYILENDWLSRGTIFGLSMLASCVSLIFGGVLLTGGSTGVVSLMAVFSGLSVFGWTVLDVITPELFPTQVRSTAFGFFTAVGRVGSICGDLLFGLFSHSSFVLPIVISAVFLLVGSVAGLMLPSMKGKAIH